MVRFAIGGQVDKQKLAAAVQAAGGAKVTTDIKTDVEAAMAVKTGQCDYYLGACHTGGGGALAMAIAVLGLSQCATVSMPGRPPREEEIRRFIQEGKIAFGFTADHIDTAVPAIIRGILEKHEKK